MAWEQRGNRIYYYRSRKVGGRVVKEYIGTGATAELIAAHDEAERERRSADREQSCAEARRLADLAAGDEELSRTVDALAAAALMSVGYRQHGRGAWRKQRSVSEGEAT